MLVLEVAALLLVLLALLITLLAEPLHGVAHASVSLVDLPALPPLDGLLALKAVSDTCVADRIASLGSARSRNWLFTADRACSVEGERAYA